MASKRAKAAARAAKRIPLVGTAVVLAPVARAGGAAFGSDLGNVFKMANWQIFLSEVMNEFTHTSKVAATYSPIVAYLVARRFAGKHISRILRPLGVKF